MINVYLKWGWLTITIIYQLHFFLSFGLIQYYIDLAQRLLMIDKCFVLVVYMHL